MNNIRCYKWCNEILLACTSFDMEHWRHSTNKNEMHWTFRLMKNATVAWLELSMEKWRITQGMKIEQIVAEI